VTKGVSNVTGCDDPLLQNVIRSRKNKDLITFWSVSWGMGRSGGQVHESRAKAILAKTVRQAANGERRFDGPID
jgi:hypothetical protein